ncbi:hypothetical protein ABFS83_04G172000 [Erythranthe nasuta]
MSITIIDQVKVAPPPGAAAEQTLRLQHFDIIWLPYRLMQNLFFYSFPCSESNFSDTIIPNLKKSLSLTLKHFPPFAGKIIFPLTAPNRPPFSHYISGDAISLTIAVSNADLIPLTGNNISRDSDQFHHFVPELPPPATHSPEQIKFAVAAVQVTLFPNQGICVGFTNHQAIGDGSTTVGFLQTWASINKSNGREFLSPPFYERNIVPNSDKLIESCWEIIRTYKPTLSSSVSLPTYKTRATFILTESEIQQLKNFVKTKNPGPNVSSFAVICAYVWTCLAKSTVDDVADDTPEYFTCTADCRRRLNPPLRDNYFGNCLGLVQGESTHGRLKGEEGIVFGAEVINEAIQKTVNNERAILEGSIVGFLERRKLSGKRVFGVTGSPRFDLYGADFGWGKPKKFEAVHIDCGGSVSLCKSREFKGGVEIGLSMKKVEMDAFEAIFNQGFKDAM